MYAGCHPSLWMFSLPSFPLPHFPNFRAELFVKDGTAFARFLFHCKLQMAHLKFYECDFELSIQMFTCWLRSLTTRNLVLPIKEDEIVMTTRKAIKTSRRKSSA